MEHNTEILLDGRFDVVEKASRAVITDTLLQCAD